MGNSAIEEKMEAARKLGHALAADAGGAIDSVYIAGSLTAGLGNPTSDADLFVLLNPGVPVGDEAGQYSVDGHRVDVERFCLVDVEAMVEKIAAFELRRDGLTALHKLPDDLDFVFRLNSSETVVESEALLRLRRRITDSLPAVRRTAINYFAIALNGHLEDFLGAAAEGDLDTAAFAGQQLVAYAGKAVAAASGDLYFSNKWVYKQLARTPVEGFSTGLFRHYQRGAWTEGGTDAAESLVLFTQTCVTVSQLLAEAGVPLSGWPSWQHGNRGTGLWRNTTFNVLRIPEGVLLHWELNRQLVLKEQPAYVWALCDGRSVDEIVAGVLSLAERVPALEGMTRERVEAVLAALQKRGLVGTEPFSFLSTV
jgi:predicted nucleotidyltransferase